VVDDRSGVAYQEYLIVYGEDVPAALRFLFRAMAPKTMEGFPFQSRPHMLYLDNGPIAKSQFFRRVMRYLDIEVRYHMPQGKGDAVSAVGPKARWSGRSGRSKRSMRPSITSTRRSMKRRPTPGC
jgi:hypothetical protein